MHWVAELTDGSRISVPSNAKKTERDSPMMYIDILYLLNLSLILIHIPKIYILLQLYINYLNHI
jgi:hypothetical protein